MKPGAKAFVVHGRRLLFILRDNDPAIAWPDHWNLPGGGIEDGETPEEALLRELEEEIGLRPRAVSYLGRQTFSGQAPVHRFLVNLSEDEVSRLNLGDEGQEMRFFEIDEVDGLRLPPNLEAFMRSIKVHLKEILHEGAEPSPVRLGLARD